MGMFDTLNCEYPLNEKIVQKESFQTKSLDCLMDNYTITKRGKLILQRRRYFENFSKKVYLDFHGDIEFYTFLGSFGENNYEWFDYIARFAEGNLQWIKRTNKRR